MNTFVKVQVRLKTSLATLRSKVKEAFATRARVKIDVVLCVLLLYVGDSFFGLLLDLGDLFLDLCDYIINGLKFLLTVVYFQTHARLWNCDGCLLLRLLFFVMLN